MEIFGTKEGDFDFKSKETYMNKDIRLELIHFPPQKVLPKGVKIFEYTNGSDSIHSSNDEKGSGGLPTKKTMIRIDQLDAMDAHTRKLKFFSKVKLFTKGGF